MIGILLVLAAVGVVGLFRVAGQLVRGYPEAQRDALAVREGRASGIVSFARGVCRGDPAEAAQVCALARDYFAKEAAAEALKAERARKRLPK